MVRLDKKTGNLIVEIDCHNGYTPLEELQIRREALYDSLTEHDNKDFLDNKNLFYGIVQMLKDTDPTDEQWKQILQS